MTENKVERYKVSLNPSMAVSHTFRGQKFEAGKPKNVTSDRISYFLNNSYFLVEAIIDKKQEAPKEGLPSSNQTIDKTRMESNYEERGPVVEEKVSETNPEGESETETNPEGESETNPEGESETNPEGESETETNPEGESETETNPEDNKEGEQSTEQDGEPEELQEKQEEPEKVVEPAKPTQLRIKVKS